MNRIGIKNLYNNCFLNSVLQLMYSMELNLTYYNSNPMDAINFYKSINKDYSIGSQEDAHECLSFLLDSIEKKHSFKIIMNQKIIREKIEESLVFENIFSLSFSDNLEKSLEDYLQDKNDDIVKEYKISIFPKYLCISIKRFNTYIDNNNIIIKKTKDSMNIPLILNIDNIEYELIGFILHKGEMNNGHYIYCDMIEKIIIDDECLFSYPTDPSLFDKMIKCAYIYLYKIK